MESLPKGYGYVVAVVGGSFLLNMYLTINVVTARKKFKVEYPLLYAPAGHKHEEAFNCVQRAHQNTLESFPMVMMQMLLCGLKYPLTSAVCGGIWVVGRFLYGYGYANNGPKGRMVGGIFSHLGDFPLAIMTFKVAYEMIAAGK
uniref:Glutathione S-transferase 3, mitochondrial n=1 Tax=Guillardia theta TaxID=55529 RepID=A0A7S4N2J1_GUITH